MKKIIKKTPIPMAGLMLGMASLGNLIQSYSESVRIVFGIISGLLGLLIVLKVINYPKDVKEDFNNPLIASVSGTFCMALMLLSVYMKPLIGSFAIYIWYLGILLHITLIVYFTIKFILKFDIKKVFASYFIVYVGIVVASTTAPAYGKFKIGQMIFYFGFFSLISLFGVVAYRYIKHKDMADVAKPAICVFAAPVSLCLFGYNQSFIDKSVTFIIIMGIWSLLVYLFVLSKLPSLLKLGFYPSYSSFTFPFIISGLAMKQSSAFLIKQGLTGLGTIVMWISIIQTAIALVITLTVLVMYVKFLLSHNK